MWPYVVKVALTALLVVGISEVARRSSFWAALLASLPLTSLLAFAWIYLDTGDTEKVSALSQGVFWLVIASLPLFLVLPALLRHGWGFWAALSAACGITVVAYLAMVWLLPRWGVRLLD